MFNYCLLSKSYSKASTDSIEGSLRTLNDLVISERNEDEKYLLCSSIWNIEAIEGLFSDVVFTKMSDQQFMYQVLPRLFQAIQTADCEIETFDTFDKLFQKYNAFYGINFSGMDTGRCITCKEAYLEFRDKKIWDLTPDSFWERRGKLFSNIIFCEDVEEYIKRIGGTYLNQIITKLRELDRYSKAYWLNGPFNYNDANQKSALNISPESKSTMDNEKYRNMRTFSLPDGRKECFELHIKTGDLRFHFLPEGKKVYIGYIGKHLDTSKF